MQSCSEEILTFRQPYGWDVSVEINVKAQITVFIDAPYAAYRKRFLSLHCVSKKSIPTFLTLTWKPIVRFW